MGARRSRAEWVEINREFEQSGEPLRTFCTKRRIRPETLTWWRWRMGSSSRAMTPKRPTSEVRLVPVDVIGLETAARSSAIVIAIAEVEVRVEVGTDAAYVGTLVAALRSRC